jgi:hypothetical protein
MRTFGVPPVVVVPAALIAVIVVVAAVLVVPVLGKDGGAPADAPEPRSPAARKAKTKRDLALKAAADAYAAAVLAANRQYLLEIEDALDAALEAKDLEEAKRLDGVKEQVEAEVRASRNGAVRILSKAMARQAPEKAFDDLQRFAPGWSIANCTAGRITPAVGLHDELAGRRNVFVTSPPERGTPCALGCRIRAEKGTTLHLEVGSSRAGADWTLVVVANDKELLRKDIAGWTDLDVDLSQFAGRAVNLEVRNANGGKQDWWYEHGLWGEISVK